MANVGDFMVYILILVGVFLLYWFVLRKFKVPKLLAITVFTGGVKVGKSAVSLYFAIKTYKRKVRSWRFQCFMCKLLRREKPEKPLFYSNIPLRGMDYCPITKDHLLRKVRFNYKSVVYFDEMSLVADSMLGMVKDGKVNDELLLFFKLFGHATHGGNCFVNTHCITDLHYALRRCTSTYFYIHHLGWFPFVRIPLIREEKYSEDGTTVNAYNDDVEDSMRRVLMLASVFKKYDCYCYSVFTDDLPTRNEILHHDKHDSLKADHIISFRRLFDELQVSSSVTDTLLEPLPAVGSTADLPPLDPGVDNRSDIPGSTNGAVDLPQENISSEDLENEKKND